MPSTVRSTEIKNAVQNLDSLMMKPYARSCASTGNTPTDPALMAAFELKDTATRCSIGMMHNIADTMRNM